MNAFIPTAAVVPAAAPAPVTENDSINDDMDSTTMIVIDGTEFSVAEVANADVSSVKPFYGFEAFPAGIYDFNVLDAQLDTLDTAAGKKLIIRFFFTCLNVHQVKDKSIDTDELLGRDYIETIFLNDVVRDVGKARAIVESAGHVWSPSLKATLSSFANAKIGITAGVTSYHHKEKDRTYANLDLRSIKPLVA